MKKLKNERGESILMALLLLLLASVISALILTAATNAAHHLRNDRKAQQNYLTVSSAAELIRDSILQESYTRVWEKVTTYTKDDDTGTYVPKEEKTTLAPGKFTGIMKAWLAAGIENNTNEGAQYASVTGCQDTIKVDVPIEGEDGSKPYRRSSPWTRIPPILRSSCRSFRRTDRRAPGRRAARQRTAG